MLPELEDQLGQLYKLRSGQDRTINSEDRNFYIPLLQKFCLAMSICAACFRI